MKFDRRKRTVYQSEILNDQSIDSDVVQFEGKVSGLFKLAVIKNCIKGNMNSCPELMSIIRKAGNIINGVGNIDSGSERRTADVDGISTAVYGGHAAFQILCRSEEFDTFH